MPGKTSVKYLTWRATNHLFQPSITITVLPTPPLTYSLLLLHLILMKPNCTLEAPLNLSSHDPITTAVSVEQEKTNNENKFGDTYLDFKRQKVIWEASKLPEYQQLANNALSDALSYWDTPDSIPLLSSLMSTLLVKCASMVFTSTKDPITTLHSNPASPVSSENEL